MAGNTMMLVDQQKITTDKKKGFLSGVVRFHTISFKFLAGQCHCLLTYRAIYYHIDTTLSQTFWSGLFYGLLTRYANLWAAHPPGMPGIFPCHRLQRKPPVSDPGMHHDTCATHVPWYIGIANRRKRGGGGDVPGIPGAHNPQSYVSGKRPMAAFK